MSLLLLLLHLMLIVVHLLVVWVTLVNHVWTDVGGLGLGLLQGLGGGLHQLLLQLPALLLLLYCQTLVRDRACVGQ